MKTNIYKYCTHLKCFILFYTEHLSKDVFKNSLAFYAYISFPENSYCDYFWRYRAGQTIDLNFLDKVKRLF